MSLNLPFMPVSEALNILKQNNYNVEHATLVILNQCNIRIKNASWARIRKKLMKEKKRRRQAMSNGGDRERARESERERERKKERKKESKKVRK